MSYSIEYQKKAYYFDADPSSGLSEKNFFAYHLCADNNVEPRTPSPRLVEFGWNYSVIQEVCKLAGYCEGGTLKPKNRWTSPEAYIKAWRKVLAEAKPFCMFLSEFPQATLKLAVEPSKLDAFLFKNDPKEAYKRELIQKAIAEEKASTIQFCGNKIIEFRFLINSKESIEAYQSLRWALKDLDLIYYAGMSERFDGWPGVKYKLAA